MNERRGLYIKPIYLDSSLQMAIYIQTNEQKKEWFDILSMVISFFFH